MGSTITTGKLASAYKDASGVIWYSLYEEMYEKNCYPHTPKWCCIYFGALEAAIEKIFKYGSSCEGGMLRSRSGALLAENYIASWLRELANPVHHDPGTVTLKVSDSWRASIPTTQADAAYAILSRFGYSGVVDVLKEGKAHELSMQHDAPVIAALFGNASGLGPWRVIEHAPVYAGRNASLGRSASKKRKAQATTIPNVLRVSENDEGLLVQQPDGTWRYGGWAYSIIGGYICSIWENELISPGSYAKAIKSLREATKTANVIPRGTKVVVDATVEFEDKWGRDSVQKLPEIIPVTHTATGYEFELPLDPSTIRRVFSLPRESAQWVLPQATLKTTELEFLA
ncbi:hypothetical protein [Diaphorobacter sp. J5-51]|uniref:hypothetical protein n=1 Tax=Diaphorobacter sp. J5-51 TaxID=680496 RepID=UPI0006431D1F|nr:hypothetical protein [Diaphorobacter sp. J5-51]KLR57124.1 hypothetical protein OX89_14115 [Diaphorobacter sp. J5-51]